MNTTEQRSMNRYRWWKVVIAPLLGLAAFGLLYGDFEPSWRWFLGLGIALTLGTAYVAEEVFWMVRNQGRPCAHCGAKVRLKAFRVKAACPNCGGQL